MNDIEKMRLINEWFGKNHTLFKLDEYYGIEITNELFQLVKTCSSDGGVLGFDVAKSNRVDSTTGDRRK